MRFNTLPTVFYTCVCLCVLGTALNLLLDGSNRIAYVAPDPPTLSVLASEPDPERGARLWARYLCSEHHAPAPFGVVHRWEAYTREDLFTMIHRTRPDRRVQAVATWQPWQPPVYMSNFPDLSDRDVDDMLAYVQSKG